MSYSACDLQADVDRLLDRLSIEVTGDDEDGFTIRRGHSTVHTDQGTYFDSAAEACGAGLQGLFDHIEDLLSAAKAVIGRWERGDLAEAVRELDVCVRVLDERAPGEAGHDKVSDRLKARLAHLVRDGLSFGDCVQAFGVTEQQDPTVGLARRLFHQEGDIEIETTTVVSRDEGDGAYVLAWAHVPEDEQAQSSAC